MQNIFTVDNWINYDALYHYPELKNKQLNALYYTGLNLDNRDDLGTLSFSFMPLKELLTLEKDCRELYDAIAVKDTDTSLCDEIYHTTSIEGSHTTRVRTAELHNGAEISHNDYNSEKMVVNAFAATKYFNVQGCKVNEQTIRQGWEILTEDVCENAEIKGVVYRTGSVGAGKMVGLDVECIKPAMDNYIQFYNSSELDDMPFLKCALLHYAFERIHPFCDGNGRMGRLLANNYLIGRGYDKIRAVSFTTAIDTNITGYYNALDDSLNAYFDCTVFLQYMVQREANALCYAYLQNKLEEKINFVDKRVLYGLASKQGCDNVAVSVAMLTTPDHTSIIEQKAEQPDDYDDPGEL